MSLVRFDGVTKSYAGHKILDRVDFQVEAGERIGLIGRNGSGKTTIFRLITGRTTPESGNIERMRKARFAYLEQEPNILPEETIWGVVLRSFEALRRLEQELRGVERQIADGEVGLLERYSALQERFAHEGGYEYEQNAKRVLTGLGFAPDEFSLPFRALSGGQRTRLMLAMVLLEDADLLLLDEPENHLDLAAREWLESFLKTWPHAFVVISHDRRLLNETVQRIVEIEHGGLIGFTGDYDAYLGQKALRQEQQQKEYDRQQRFIGKEESWIERFRYKKTKASQVQSRIRRLSKLERVAPPRKAEGDPAFGFEGAIRSAQAVVVTDSLSMSYGDLKLYESLSFHVERGERVGIIGPNGSGKTTLLRHMLDKVESGRGKITFGEKVSVGFFDQHQSELAMPHDVLTEILRCRPDMTPEQGRTFLGRLLFTGEEVFKPVSNLSGGELTRLAMAKLMLGDANLLLLDEPTNHLDIASRQALEEALVGFPGTLVMVSHDRALIDRLVGKLVVLEGGRAEVHLGNYTDYLWHRREEANQEAEEQAEVLKIRRAEAKPRKRRQREGSDARKRLEALERDIEAMEALVEEYETGFGELIPEEHERARTMKEEYDGLCGDLKGLYDEWEALVDEMSE